MKKRRPLAWPVAALVLSGCAHSIRIVPDAPPPESPGGPQSQASVGYFISDEERARRVTTPGGGGDKVEYAPYKDLEPSLYHVLNRLFAHVYVLKSVDDSKYLTEKGITIVLRPQISTNSSSSSIFTWPPTEFEVVIDVKALDSQGAVIWQDTARGKGQAEFSEFKSDFGLAAKRASAQAVAQLRDKLSSSPLAR